MKTTSLPAAQEILVALEGHLKRQPVEHHHPQIGESAAASEAPQLVDVDVVLDHALAVIVEEAEDPLCDGVALLCRSGVRSIAAARRATELGLQAYNILEGFEGDADELGQRGHRGGWRFQGLPWLQK